MIARYVAACVSVVVLAFLWAGLGFGGDDAGETKAPAARPEGGARAAATAEGTREKAADGEKGATPNQKVMAALRKTVFAEAATHEVPLSDFLALLVKMTDSNIILDPTLPEDVRKTQVTVRVKKGTTAADALGVALAIAGLRYVLADGAVFISTPGKLADRLIYGEAPSKPLGADRASLPMTTGEAVALTSDLDDDDGFVPIESAIRFTPWRIRRLPWRDPVTGLMQYPAPPLWQEDPDIGSPRFRFSHQPSFLKPEYLAEFVYADREKQQREAGEEELLRAILKLLKENPDMTAEEILKKLGVETPAKKEAKKVEQK
ncbi:MAG: STN domain-containing protein [Planctomycetota bacterium]|nr:STN domain-containing protein [Planctomycetota bacterium]